MHALEKDEVDVFVSMGGNFAAAGSDTAALEAGHAERLGLTVHISTKPNRVPRGARQNLPDPAHAGPDGQG